MSFKILIVYKSPILFDVLNEIKENLNFKVEHFNDNDLDNLYYYNSKDYLIISYNKNNINECKLLNIPNKIDKIIEQINIWFLSNKFTKQSKIEIGNYYLDLNSRQIFRDDNKLNLTEKETELILFIMENEFVSLKDLQKKVWRHALDLETHTVETHIYRLRKKFFVSFNDKEFIKHNKKGYHLN